MRIAFGFPHGEITPQFHNSVVGLLLNEMNTPEDMRLLGSYLPQGGCYVSVNRNKIATRFLQPGCTDDYLLMIDTDIEFQSHILYQFKELIDEYPDAEIIAGRANIGNGLPVFFNRSSHGFLEHQIQPFKGLKTFDMVGCGIILISRKAFLKLFDRCHTNFFTHLVVESSLEGDIIPREVGDDFSFCMRVGVVNDGLKIYGSWDIFGQHYKMQPIKSRYPENFEEALIK